MFQLKKKDILSIVIGDFYKLTEAGKSIGIIDTMTPLMTNMWTIKTNLNVAILETTVGKEIIVIKDLEGFLAALKKMGFELKKEEKLNLFTYKK